MGQENGFVIVNLSPNFPDKFIFTDSFATHGDDEIEEIEEIDHNIDELNDKKNVWKNIDFKEAIVEIIRWKKTVEDAIYWHTE